jgi:hypothetical protein
MKNSKSTWSFVCQFINTVVIYPSSYTTYIKALLHIYWSTKMQALTCHKFIIHQLHYKLLGKILSCMCLARIYIARAWDCIRRMTGTTASCKLRCSSGLSWTGTSMSPHTRRKPRPRWWMSKLLPVNQNRPDYYTEGLALLDYSVLVLPCFKANHIHILYLIFMLLH